MWYFKETAKSLWQASKGIVVDNRSKVQKILDQIADSDEEIISTNKLNELAAVTFEIQKFQQTLQTVLKKIKTFQYDIDEARKTHNILIATNYLIKHGASAFVDQLRNYINVFKKYQNLKDLKTYEDQGLQKQLSYELQKIKSRARHIQVLLSDKNKLLKQKQLAMLIKQKMKLYEKSRVSESNQSLNNDNRKERLQKERQRITDKSTGKQNKHLNDQHNKDYADKIDGFLEKFLWKYVDKLDGKIQVISDKVMQNFEKYVLGQLPQNFEPEEIDEEAQNEYKQDSDKKMKKQMPPPEYQSLDQDDLMRKLQQEGQNIHDCNLIQFEEVKEQQPTKNNNLQQDESLI